MKTKHASHSQCPPRSTRGKEGPDSGSSDDPDVTVSEEGVRVWDTELGRDPYGSALWISALWEVPLANYQQIQHSVEEEDQGRVLVSTLGLPVCKLTWVSSPDIFLDGVSSTYI